MTSKSNIYWLAALAAAVVTVLTLGACDRTPAAEATPADELTHAGDQVKRGQYLVNAMMCHDCHTPHKLGPNGPELDTSRLLSGHPENLKMPAAPAHDDLWTWSGAATMTAFAGPWGVSYAMNLTPDENTGLGIWTEDMFVTAMRTGRHMGTSRPILPPMPWEMVRTLKDEDIKAIYAYLRTIKPITNHVPEPQPPAAAASTGGAQ
jgi:mono/diheme cytochrome c family protein